MTFQGGREVRGVLKGFDQLVNIVLDDCVEEMHDPDDPYKKTDERRRLGLVVCRGLQVSLVSPCRRRRDGTVQLQQSGCRRVIMVANAVPGRVRRHNAELVGESGSMITVSAALIRRLLVCSPRRRDHP